MTWIVQAHEDFAAEVQAFPPAAQIQLVGLIRLLKRSGPQLKRPQCDTLKGSKHANMKELRFDAAGGVWRVAFAFDPNRQAVLLVGGNKSGVSQKRFYRDLIRLADERFDDWLETL